MSDSIVISINEIEHNALEKIIWATMQIQATLLCRRPSWLSRGAISYGDLFFDGEQIIFGKALVNAVLIESQKEIKYMRNPRVIIDKDNICIDQEYKYLKLDNVDNNYFVDYMPAFLKDITFYIEEVKEYLDGRIPLENKDIADKLSWFQKYLIETEEYLS